MKTVEQIKEFKATEKLYEALDSRIARELPVKVKEIWEIAKVEQLKRIAESLENLVKYFEDKP